MSPRTDVQLQTQREQSRAKILQAALSLFAREGYERTSVRMIALEAGVAQGLLYNYFESKEALLQALLKQSMRDVYESFESLKRPGDPRERLKEYFRHSFEILRRNRDFWRLSYGVRMQPAVLAGLGDEVQSWTDTIRRTLEGLLGEAGYDAPQVEAAILFALIDGVSQHYTLDPDHYPLDAVVDRLIARYCRIEPTSTRE